MTSWVMGSSLSPLLGWGFPCRMTLWRTHSAIITATTVLCFNHMARYSALNLWIERQHKLHSNIWYVSDAMHDVMNSQSGERGLKLSHYGGGALWCKLVKVIWIDCIHHRIKAFPNILNFTLSVTIFFAAWVQWCASFKKERVVTGWGETGIDPYISLVKFATKIMPLFKILKHLSVFSDFLSVSRSRTNGSMYL